MHDHITTVQLISRALPNVTAIIMICRYKKIIKEKVKMGHELEEYVNKGEESEMTEAND